jgi:stringent starvation protein B
VTQKPIQMTDQKPYLLRAIYEWLSDNGGLVYVQVWLEHPGIKLPPHIFAKAKAAKRDYEVLNISMTATDKLNISNMEITANARFNGADFRLVLPVDAIQFIYSPNLPQPNGMQFQAVRPVTPTDVDKIDLSKVTGDPPMAQEKPKDESTEKKKPPFLSVVK